MYDPNSGAYYFLANERFANEGKYRFESTYYIRYNAKKALYAFEMLQKQATAASPDIFLCHIYLDLLLDASGMLRRWFNDSDRRLSDERKQQTQINRTEYEYDENAYPALSSIHKVRNFAEHINEKDDQLIGDSLYNGTFNVIYEDMDPTIRAGLNDSSKPQNNVLDLESMVYIALIRENGNAVEKRVNLRSLEDEIRRIHERAELIWTHLTTNWA